MVRAFLIGASPSVDLQQLKRGFRLAKFVSGRDLLIAVDGGLETCLRLGLRADWWVGDADSWVFSRSELLESAQAVVDLPRNKDRSDFYFAVQSALWRKVTHLYAFGVTGGRADHHLAVLQDLAHFSGKGFLHVSAHGTDGDYFFLSERISQWKQLMKAGRLISLFALSESVTGVTVRGVRFPLGLRTKATLKGSSGLSNEAKAGTCLVSLKKGRLLVLLPATE